MEADLQVSLVHFEGVVRPIYKSALARAAEVSPSAVEITKLEEKEIGEDSPLLQEDTSPNSADIQDSAAQSHARGLKEQTVLLVVSNINVADKSSTSEIATVRDKVEANWDNEVVTELDVLGVVVLSVQTVIVASEEGTNGEEKEVYQDLDSASSTHSHHCSPCPMQQ